VVLVVDTLSMLLCVQERYDEQHIVLDWDSIKRTVLENLADYDFTEDLLTVQANTEPSLLEIVEKQWVQRVSIKTQKCSIEEHPQATAVSTVPQQYH
jgi:hypothetical protein